MNDKRKGLLFQTKKQMNNGAIATGLGFVLYLALLAMGLELPADLVAVAFGVVGIFNSFSVLEGRRKDKENISYNLLWGQLALTIFLVACAVLAVKQRLGAVKGKRRNPSDSRRFFLIRKRSPLPKWGGLPPARARPPAAAGA